MKKLKHSPSHSERWMNCPGALALCDTLPPADSSGFAREGTAAHELAASCLKSKEDAAEWIGEPIEVEDDVFIVDEKMAEHVQVYLDAVRSDMEQDGVPHSALMVEVKFELKLPELKDTKSVPGIPIIKGTCDAAYAGPFGTLRVYDLKYGAGQYVDVVENSQLTIYDLGAVEALGHTNGDTEIVIVQPRYVTENVSPVRRWEATEEYLIEFRQKVVDAVGFSYTKNAPLKAGNHCKWCPAFGVCPGARGKVLTIIPENQVLTFPEVTSLTPEHISEILNIADYISMWVKTVRAHAEKEAKELGITIPGYKLVQKTGNRAWIDELVVENEFEHEFGDVIYDKKLKGPAKIEKIVGKERVAPLCEKPDRGIQLVPESAKGEAITASLKQVFNVID